MPLDDFMDYLNEIQAAIAKQGPAVIRNRPLNERTATEIRIMQQHQEQIMNERLQRLRGSVPASLVKQAGVHWEEAAQNYRDAWEPVFEPDNRSMIEPVSSLPVWQNWQNVGSNPVPSPTPGTIKPVESKPVPVLVPAGPKKRFARKFA